MKVAGIIPAAGLGVRMAGGRSAQGAAPPKQLVELEGVPILLWTLRRLASCPRLDRFIVAVRKSARPAVESALAKEDFRDRVALAEGGETRQDSVANALTQVGADAELVLVHDGVRPFISPELVEKVIGAAEETGAAILGLPATDTVKQVEPAGGEHASRITATIPREKIVLAQTPQVFRAELLRQAIERATADGFHGSDEAVLVERLGRTVAVVLGSEQNIKITRPGDLDLARYILSNQNKGMGV
jgi:2-C-methyl-D-erythritol 4-phosphate cytidylyltransferase